MRPAFALLAVSSLALASVATAAPVMVDFSVVSSPVDLTTSSPVLDGVTISYLGPTAQVDSSGISGDSAGELDLGFATAIGAVKFDWTVENVSGQPSDPGVMFFANNGDAVILPGTYVPYDPETPDVGRLTGTLMYQGVTGFTLATCYFSLGGNALVPDPGNPGNSMITTFTVSGLEYQVPEPTIIGAGLAMSTGLLVRRRVARAGR